MEDNTSRRRCYNYSSHNAFVRVIITILTIFSSFRGELVILHLWTGVVIPCTLILKIRQNTRWCIISTQHVGLKQHIWLCVLCYMGVCLTLNLNAHSSSTYKNYSNLKARECVEHLTRACVIFLQNRNFIFYRISDYQTQFQVLKVIPNH